MVQVRTFGFQTLSEIRTCWNLNVLWVSQKSQMSEIWTCWNLNWLLFGFRHCPDINWCVVHKKYVVLLHCQNNIFDLEIFNYHKCLNSNLSEVRTYVAFRHQMCKKFKQNVWISNITVNVQNPNKFSFQTFHFSSTFIALFQTKRPKTKCFIWPLIAKTV